MNNDADHLYVPDSPGPVDADPGELQDVTVSMKTILACGYFGVQVWEGFGENKFMGCLLEQDSATGLVRQSAPICGTISPQSEQFLSNWLL